MNSTKYIKITDGSLSQGSSLTDTLLAGGLQIGVVGSTQPLITISSLHPTAQWRMVTGNAPNTDLVTFDHVLNFGWNVDTLGGLVDQTEPSMADSWEVNYLTGGQRYFERHVNFQFPDGTSRRPWSILVNRSSGLCSAGLAGEFFLSNSEITAHRLHLQDGVAGTNVFAFWGNTGEGGVTIASNYNNVTFLSALSTDGGFIDILKLDDTGGVTATPRDSGNGPFPLTNGMVLNITIDGIAQTFTAKTADYVAIGAATSAEMTIAANAQLIGSPASAVGAKLRFSSPIKSVFSEVRITGGTMNTIMGYNTAANIGSGNSQLDVLQLGSSGKPINFPGGAITSSAGTGGLLLSSMTGAAALPTGNLSWSGADGTKTASLISLATLTLTGGTSSTWGLTGAGSALSLKSDNTVHVILNGTALAVQANINITAAAGTSAFSWGSASGAFAFPTGNVTWASVGGSTFELTGSLKIHSNIPITMNSGTKGFRFVQAGGSPDVWQWDCSGFDGSSMSWVGIPVIFSSGLTSTAIVGTAGAGAVTLGAMTGDTTLPTGSLSWSGATGKTAAFIATAAAITITAAAASTWSTSSGALTIDGNAGINLKKNTTLFADFGVTTSANITFTANIDLIATNLEWIATTSAPIIWQATRTTDALPQALTIAPQAPKSDATGANRTPGDLIVNIAAPTNASTTEGALSLQRGGTTQLQLKYNAGLPLIGGVAGQISTVPANSSIYIRPDTSSGAGAVLVDSLYTWFYTSFVKFYDRGAAFAFHFDMSVSNAPELSVGATRAAVLASIGVTTSNATQTTLKSVTLVDNTVYTFTVAVTARDQAGTHRGRFERRCYVYRQAAGNATLGSIETIGADDRTNAGLDVTFTVSGSAVRISVTGLAATTIDWGLTEIRQGVSTTA